MDLKRNVKFIEVQEFLEDIYIYLNNSHSSITSNSDQQTNDDKRLELINKCKYIRNLFENEFNPCSDDVDSSYLEMNGNGNTKNPPQDNPSIFNPTDKKEETLKEDYVNMVTEAACQEDQEGQQTTDNVYDNCTVNSSAVSSATNSPSQLLVHHDRDKDKLTCPFVGLPAAHLKIINSPKFGLLYRIEKKIFFDQTKHYYAGVMNRWLLLYSATSNDMKPSMCLYVEDVGVDTIFDGAGKKRENLFHVQTNTGKRYQFQALSADDMREWITVMMESILQDKKTEPSDDITRSTRKLPTPPPSSPAFYKNFYPNQRQSVKSEERIYEEPSSVSSEPEPESTMEPESQSENCYDIVSFNSELNNDEEQPPDLPVKLGKKIVPASEKHEYDTPKTLENNERSVESSSVNTDTDTSQSKPEIKGLKVSQVKAILSAQKMPISPLTIEEKKQQQQQQKVMMRDKEKEKDKETAKENRTPVKSWFMRQINKSTEKSKSRKSGKFSKSSTSSPESSPSPTESLVKSVKGGKVNMIISQLEANGQLQILSKSLRDRKSLVFDGEEYEPVNIKDNKM